MQTRSIATLIVVLCLFITSCSSSSSSNNTSSQSSSGQTTATTDAVLETNTSFVWQVGADLPISVMPGDNIIRNIIVPTDGAVIDSIELSNAPEWVSVNADNQLLASPPANADYLSEYSVQVQATISPGTGGTGVATETVLLRMGHRNVLLDATYTAEGGRFANQWGDVLLWADSGLQNTYAIQVLLEVRSEGSYALSIASEPAIDPADIGKFSFDSAPVSELYLNYGAKDQSSRHGTRTANRTGDLIAASELQTRSAATVNALSKYAVPTECSNIEYKDIKQDGYLANHLWWGKRGLFVTNASREGALEKGGEPRIVPWEEENFESSFRNMVENSQSNIVTAYQCAVALQSSYSSWNSVETTQREPVLLIHGFDKTGYLGGRDDYFYRFPAMIDKLNIDGRRFYPVIFRWDTNARFDVVAQELGQAIELLSNHSGRKVHLVGHSFGGVLIRTLLQGIRDINADSYYTVEQLEKLVATVTTVGSPHSGVFGDTEQVNIEGQSRTFNRGFADNITGKFSELCDSVTCHMLGQEYSDFFSPGTGVNGFNPRLQKGVGINDVDVGELAFRLADTYPASYPNIPTNVLIGAYAKRVGILPLWATGNPRDFKIQGHDLLISAYGQLWKSSTNRALQKDIESGPVNEYYLGNRYVLADDFTRGMFDANYDHNEWRARIEIFDGGYAHMSSKANHSNYSEVGLEECDPNQPALCKHAVWHYFKDLVSQSQNPAFNEQRSTITIFGQLEADNISVANMPVNIAYEDGTGLSTTTDNAGQFSVDLLFKANSTITIGVSPSVASVSTNSANFRATSVPVYTQDSLQLSSGYAGVIRLISPEQVSGTLSINALNIYSDQVLDNYSYAISASNGSQVVQGTSDSATAVSVKLPEGSYNISVERSGYESVSNIECEVQKQASSVCAVFLTPTTEFNPDTDGNQSQHENTDLLVTADGRQVSLLIASSKTNAAAPGALLDLERFSAHSSGQFAFIVSERFREVTGPESYTDTFGEYILGIGSKAGYMLQLRESQLKNSLLAGADIGAPDKIQVASDGSAVFVGSYIDADATKGDYAIRVDADGSMRVLLSEAITASGFGLSNDTHNRIEHFSHSAFGTSLVLANSAFNERFLVRIARDGAVVPIAGPQSNVAGAVLVDGCPVMLSDTYTPARQHLYNDGVLIFQAVSDDSSACAMRDGIYKYTGAYSALITESDVINNDAALRHRLIRIRGVIRDQRIHFKSSPAGFLGANTEWLLSRDGGAPDLLSLESEPGNEKLSVNRVQPAKGNRMGQVVLFTDDDLFFGRAHIGQPHATPSAPGASALSKLIPVTPGTGAEALENSRMSFSKSLPAVDGDGTVFFISDNGIVWSRTLDGNYQQLIGANVTLNSPALTPTETGSGYYELASSRIHVNDDGSLYVIPTSFGLSNSAVFQINAQ